MKCNQTIQMRSFYSRWTAGTDIIEYETGGGENSNNYMQSMSALTSGQTLDWGTASIQNQRTYGIKMEVRPSMFTFY